MKKNILLIFILLTSFVSLLADSPITSTAFYKAYQDNEMVKSVAKSSGEINPTICDYLNTKSISIDKKVAVINALSWQHAGVSNSDKYLNYIIEKNKRISLENYLQKCNEEQLICIAYLKAMDDYFDVKEALKIADKAIEKNPKSFTIHIIHALIKAQFVFDENWCKVYQVADKVRKKTKLKQDLKTAAVQIIFDYLILYESYCEENK